MALGHSTLRAGLVINIYATSFHRSGQACVSATAVVVQDAFGLVAAVFGLDDDDGAAGLQFTAIAMDVVFGNAHRDEGADPAAQRSARGRAADGAGQDAGQKSAGQDGTNARD